MDAMQEAPGTVAAPASDGDPRRSWAGASAGVVALGLGACGGGGGGGNSTGAVQDPPADGAVTPAAAARFLAQASYGADDDSIGAVAAHGYAGWIERQFTEPQTLHRPYVEAAIAAGPPGTTERTYRDHVMDTFWKQAITGRDQLRQRLVFALTQIFVVSQTNDDVYARPRGLADYLDTLGAHAFGNFRALLEAVTLHPIMGVYLSMLRNQKGSPATGRVPDENYAREVMQLFTIGLYCVNADGSPRHDGSGEPLPTYDNDDVQGLAAALTGWSWAGPDRSDLRFFGVVADPDRDVTPMQSYPAFHAETAKSFLEVTIGAGGDAVGSLRTALDTLFNHPNTAPFICRQLIQRLVTSNPSAGYVARVAAAFADNGRRQRGDMQAVIRAILLDYEARSDSAAAQPHAGKLREPVMRLASWARAFKAVSTSGNYTIRNVGEPANALGQNPLRAPSVFNFFRPGYVPPSTVLAEAGLVAPEFQITGETSVAGYLNFMRTVVDAGVGLDADVHSRYTEEAALAGDPDRLVARVALLLTADRMTAATRAAIGDAVASIPADADAASLNRARLAVYLTLACPEFIVQQ